jgi:hypothetical protein
MTRPSLSTYLQVSSSLFFVSKYTCGLNNIISSMFAPWNF